jgi:hypothetical protein
VQPDDADWHADDVRYNVLRWTSSPRPPFGGYGPSVANPLTGQIIAADIMLEYAFMKGRWLNGQMFTDGTKRLTPNFSLPLNHYCSLGHGMANNLAFAHYAGLAKGMGDIEKDKLLRQTMYYLILHEVGHTLGLNHNMRATQLYDHKTVHDDKVTQGIVAGSVMDYPAINFAPVGMQQGDFYNERPGPYDDWMIEYGYSQAETDPEAEEQRLQAILNRSTQPDLVFGNDADDMREPGRHIDPRVNIFDHSNNAVAYAQDRLELIRYSTAKLKDKLLQEGRSHNDLVVGANIMLVEMARQAEVTSRYIGGIYVDRSLVGQSGYQTPYIPVPESLQRQAMSSLNQHIFSADLIDSFQPMFAYLQKQRRMFEGFEQNEDPKIQQAVLAMQKRVLDHLLHPQVMQRITDSSL